jgi:ABC-2 type transport system ATP-binding protein
LTARLSGSEILSVTVDGPEEDVRKTIGSLPGVVRTEAKGAENGARTYEIESAGGADIRRDLARTIVQGGFGLLELKQVDVSLEDIYLQLTTTEEAQEGQASEASPPKDSDSKEEQQ